VPRYFVFTLGFNKAEMIEGALQNFEETTTAEENRHVIKTLINPWFPGTEREALCSLAGKYGWWGPVDVPNISIMENWNTCIHDLAHMRKGDYLFCFDPDVRMGKVGWISAMVEALDSDDSAVFCSAGMDFHTQDWFVKDYQQKITVLPSGVRVARYGQLIAWSSGAWKGDWLAARPRDFKAPNKVYGYLEHADLALMKKHGKTWVSVPDYIDYHKGSDPVYSQWKIESAQHKTDIHYAQWLKDRK